MPSPKRAAWYHSLRAHTAVLELMDQELMDACGHPLAFYDVLIEIWRAPGHALRMNELAGKCSTQSQLGDAPRCATRTRRSGRTPSVE